MKREMRQKLTHLPFEKKIRRVGELIQLSRRMKTQRVREGSTVTPKEWTPPAQQIASGSPAQKNP